MLLIVNILTAHYKTNLAERQKKKELKKQEKLKWKHAKVTLNNFLLNSITQHHEIILSGEPGTGKSIMMNLITKFIVSKTEDEFYRLRRYYRIMQPEYFKERLWLMRQQLLPVYSELAFRDYKTKARNQEFWQYFLMHKKAIYKGVFCKDEFGEDFGKDFFFQKGEVLPAVQEIEKLFRKIRHYMNGWIIGTEQDKDNIYIGFRRIGYAKVTTLRTLVQLSPFGKIKRKILNFFNLIMPAFLTINYKRTYAKIFKRDIVFTFFKSLLPSYILLPKEYYTQKKAIDSKVKLKHQRFTTRFQYENAEYFMRYTLKDIYDYDTRAYKDEYASMFDKHGNRKGVSNGN